MIRKASILLLVSVVWSVGGAGAQQSVAGAPPVDMDLYLRSVGELGFAPTAPDILEMEGLVKSERLTRSGIPLYKVNRTIPGITEMLDSFGSENGITEATGVAEYIEVVSGDINGKRVSLMRVVPPEEIERRRSEAVGMPREVMAKALDTYTLGALALGVGLRQEMPFLADIAPADGVDGPAPLRNGAAGLIVGGCGREAHGVDTGVERMLGESWLSPDPLTFMTGIACFTYFAAEVYRASDLTEEEKGARIARAREEAAERIRLLGEETVDGRPTYALAMTDLGLSQTLEDGSRVEFQSATVWIDREYLVRRKTRFEGVMHAEGQSREFFMERLERDYRNVPGTALYEPYLSIMRVGGMTTPEQEREMQEALKQLEEFDRQMASLPASQRAMMERMMGDKIEQARALAEGGAVEFEMITTSIEANPDLAAETLGVLDKASLVRVIQQDLTTLGYDPGPVNGELTDQTRAAIVAFQTDTGLEPTGEATPALASALKAAIAAR